MGKEGLSAKGKGILEVPSKCGRLGMQHPKPNKRGGTGTKGRAPGSTCEKEQWGDRHKIKLQAGTGGAEGQGRRESIGTHRRRGGNSVQKDDAKALEGGGRCIKKKKDRGHEPEELWKQTAY